MANLANFTLTHVSLPPPLPPFLPSVTHSAFMEYFLCTRHRVSCRCQKLSRATAHSRDHNLYLPVTSAQLWA